MIIHASITNINNRIFIAEATLTRFSKSRIPTYPTWRYSQKQGHDGLGADALDLAELPLLLGTVLATGKGSDSFLKRADELAPAIKNFDIFKDRGIDDILGSRTPTCSLMLLLARELIY